MPASNASQNTNENKRNNIFSRIQELNASLQDQAASDTSENDSINIFSRLHDLDVSSRNQEFDSPSNYVRRQEDYLEILEEERRLLEAEQASLLLKLQKLDKCLQLFMTEDELDNFNSNLNYFVASDK